MTIQVEKKQAVTTIILNRPEARNAVNRPTADALAHAFREFEQDESASVAVLSGHETFCAGADLKAVASGEDSNRLAVDGDGPMGPSRMLLSKPVIAAIEGHAVAGGLELALSCDMILAAEHATFALPEIRSGTVADAASLKLPKRIPYHIAMEMLLTGRWMQAEEAARWGLINRIHPADTLMTEAHALADLLASGPPLVYAAIKEIVRESEDMKFQDALNRITQSQFETVDILYNSEDQLEGARAFAEKRDPVWKGR